MKKTNLDRRTQELSNQKEGRGKISNKIVAALLVVSLATGFCLGAGVIQETKAAELTAATAQVEMQHQQTLEYYDTLTKTQAELDELQPRATEMVATQLPVIVEVEKKVQPEFREFEDLTALTAWLEKNMLPVVLIADKNGRVDALNPRATSQYDCDDYAEDLQIKALEQGFLMSQQLVLNGTVFGVKVSQHTEPHMANLAVIGNDIYYVESVPPHSVVRITRRD